MSRSLTTLSQEIIIEMNNYRPEEEEGENFFSCSYLLRVHSFFFLHESALARAETMRVTKPDEETASCVM